MCSVGGRWVHGIHIDGIHIDGGMADELVVDAQCLVPLPEGVSAEAASLVEPIAVGSRRSTRSIPSPECVFQ
jgi:threonine dehydrogenase-like Zn-dependent dehydrogenase